MGAVLFLVLGLTCVVAGVAHWSPALALVLLGVAFLGIAWDLMP